MDMEDKGLAERQAEWEDLRKRAAQDYKSDVKIDEVRLDKRGETDALIARLSSIAIEIAKIGKSHARARVYRPPATELYDTGECTVTTMEARLHRFLAQQVHMEAMRAAG